MKKSPPKSSPFEEEMDAGGMERFEIVPRNSNKHRQQPKRGGCVSSTTRLLKEQTVSKPSLQRAKGKKGKGGGIPGGGPADEDELEGEEKLEELEDKPEEVGTEDEKKKKEEEEPEDKDLRKKEKFKDEEEKRKKKKVKEEKEPEEKEEKKKKKKQKIVEKKGKKKLCRKRHGKACPYSPKGGRCNKPYHHPHYKLPRSHICDKCGRVF